MAAFVRATFASFNAKDFSKAVFRQSLIALSWLPPVIFFENHLYSVASVEGISMKPTFNPESNLMRRDLVLEDKTWTWRKGADGKSKLGRGDVVTFRSPFTTKVVVKRITGVAGDIVKTRPPREGRVVTVPEGHVWVEGDEQFHSRDSNEYGPIAINLIESKLTKIIWPPSRFGDIPQGGRDPRITKRRMNVDGNASDWEERSFHS